MLLTSKFAVGNCFIFPNGGTQPTNASPTELSTIQDFSVEFDGKGVELRGQYLYPVDARVTDVSGKGKFKVGLWSLDQLNNLFFASTVATGTTNIAIYPDEAHSVPATTPFTVTVTNATGFTQTLSVAYASNQNPLEEVASVTAAGQYSVSAGTYTFFSSDEGKAVLISYVAQTVAANAALTIDNNLQGQSPIVGIAGFNAATGDGFYFPYCRVTGIKPLSYTNNKYDVNEVDFQIFCPFGATVGQILQSSF